jgi:hypothetical protein
MKTTTASIPLATVVPVTEEAENTAFIMFIWLDACRDEYQAAYELNKDEIGGFMGMTDLAAQAGSVFNHEAGSLVAGDDYTWYEAIEGFAIEVIRHLTRASIDRADLHRLAAENIDKNKEYFAYR